MNIRLRQVEFYGTRADLTLKHGHVFTERDTVEIAGIAIAVGALFD